MNEESFTFDEWLKWAFDHPVAAEVKDEWWWHLPDDCEGGRWLDRPPEQALTFVTTLFENPLASLSRYSDEQINQGINFIAYRACSKHFEGLMDRDIDLIIRADCVRSLENLSYQLLAPRCSDDLRDRTKPLNHPCYMLWDWVVRDAEILELNPDLTYRTFRNPEIDKETLDTLVRILSMPSVACQRSALYGLGHLGRETKLGSDVIQQYLDRHLYLPNELREYAQIALAGKIV